LCETEARRRRVGVAQLFSRKVCVTTKCGPQRCRPSLGDREAGPATEASGGELRVVGHLCEAERCEPSRANPEPGSRKIRCDGDGFICDHKAMAQKISLTTSTPRRKSRGLASPALRMLDQRSVRSPCSERSGPTPGTTPRIR
jgi:hypothetical protein